MQAGPERLAAGHVKVEQAVVVVVEPDGAGAGAFEERAQFPAPKLWVNWMPAFAVASSNRIGPGAACCGACASTAEDRIRNPRNAFITLVSSRSVRRMRAGQVGWRCRLQQRHRHCIFRRGFRSGVASNAARAVRRGASRRIRLRASESSRRHRASSICKGCSLGTCTKNDPSRSTGAVPSTSGVPAASRV